MGPSRSSSGMGWCSGCGRADVQSGDGKFVMGEKTIDIGELLETLSSSLREVQEGTTLVITDQGKPVARLSPVDTGLEERVQQMLDSGMASWSGQKPPAEVPRV